MRKFLSYLLILLVSACSRPAQTDNFKPGEMKGNLIIFHAGSLSMPFKQVAEDFEKANPNVKIMLEAAGSVDCARKIIDLNRPCDIMASSDYKVIQDLLIPGYTDWLIPFASNEIVVAFTEKSRQANIINTSNWADILIGNDVAFARPDPNSDPCGYRTVLMLQLAEKYYNKPGLAENFLKKDLKYIRPKEVDLIALLEVHEADYIFNYRSVAIQHQLKFIELPDEINLGNPAFADYYAQASVEITGKKPGEKIKVAGEPIIYGITRLKNAPNPEIAEAFLEFLLDNQKGMKVMAESGQTTLIPGKNPYWDRLPERLKQFSLK